MIAPFYVPMGDIMVIRWENVGWAANCHRAFWAMGDHGYYCPIKWEAL